MRTTLVWGIALLGTLGLAACGEDRPPSPREDASPSTPVPRGEPKRFETRSDDPAIAQLQGFIEERGVDVTSPGWRLRVPRPPKVEFRPGRRYAWRLDTNQGALRIRLLPESAPMHVSSTIYLTILGFYDTLRFHRVIQGFMAQGGCPIGNGKGGPDYGYDGEFDPDLRHDHRGVVSMANMGPGTDGSQFFIMFAPNRLLDRKHTIFGDLKDGADALARIEALSGRVQPDQSAPPKAPIVIERATIEPE